MRALRCASLVFSHQVGRCTAVNANWLHPLEALGQRANVTPPFAPKAPSVHRPDRSSAANHGPDEHGNEDEQSQPSDECDKALVHRVRTRGSYASLVWLTTSRSVPISTTSFHAMYRVRRARGRMRATSSQGPTTSPYA